MNKKIFIRLIFICSIMNFSIHIFAMDTMPKSVEKANIYIRNKTDMEWRIIQQQPPHYKQSNLHPDTLNQYFTNALRCTLDVSETSSIKLVLDQPLPLTNPTKTLRLIQNNTSVPQDITSEIIFLRTMSTDAFDIFVNLPENHQNFQVTNLQKEPHVNPQLQQQNSVNPGPDDMSRNQKSTSLQYNPEITQTKDKVIISNATVGIIVISVAAIIISFVHLKYPDFFAKHIPHAVKLWALRQLRPTNSHSI